MIDNLETLVNENPFYVLELSPDCSRAEIERAAARLTGMLTLGLGQAATYPTPLGPQPRTVERVRAAAAFLRDPARRLLYEMWASISPNATLDDAAGLVAEPLQFLVDASCEAPARVEAGERDSLPLAPGSCNLARQPLPVGGWVGARRVLGWGP